MGLDSMLAIRRSLASDCGESVTNSRFNLETTKEKEMKFKEKEMKISQTFRAALIAIHTIDSAPQKPKSESGVMQRLGLAFLAFPLVIGAPAFARAREPPSVDTDPPLRDTLAPAFVQLNSQLRDH